MNTRHFFGSLSPLLVVLIIACVISLAPLDVSRAQSTTTGSIEGTATDASGAPAPGVTVTATRQGGRSVSVTTNDEGVFRFTQLEPGSYTVTVDAAKGFARFEQRNVPVNLYRTTNLEVILRSAAAAIDKPTQTAAGGNAGKVNASGGVTVVTFETSPGTVRVNLPDDIRAGDTISGTLVTEPKGQTEEERAKNRNELKSLALEINGKMVEPFTAAPEKERETVNQLTFWLSLRDEARIKPAPTTSPVTSPLATSDSGGALGFWIVLAKREPSRELLGRVTIPYVRPFIGMTPSGAVITPDPKITVPKTSSGAVITPDPKITSPVQTPSSSNVFTLPTLGQQGRLIEITGLFDGNASNTTLRFGPAGSTTQDFEKGTENVSGGFGMIRALAESPRKLVLEVPTNLVGPNELNVKDGGNQATGTVRIVGVNLSAPKTNLEKIGEKTVLTTEVIGLKGITKPVPLTLEASGVITMEGNMFQQLVIQPSQVSSDGRYVTKREITGVQVGGWSATSTVVTQPFNIVLRSQDLQHTISINSFTGDYAYCGPGINLTGTGKIEKEGCNFKLSDHKKDRRVRGTFMGCTPGGTSSHSSALGLPADIKLRANNIGPEPEPTELDFNQKATGGPGTGVNEILFSCP